ncbi:MULTISPECIES: hypothetical protein [Gammaproteobacteria]|uniref:hypothetical protein n=1 Tax=Gammaproteobacteria TaxID=1236 RepID=UPI000DCF9A71|nr:MULTISPECIES: hypothetical protein [Gammaproteobacteria]RTE86496.1 hypothetical protein DQX04_08040 [Aliidiomarina sp. B3213]TCZ90949.1 hypothetical protein EYQ95_09005 [Lysobacter sp. N42]
MLPKIIIRARRIRLFFFAVMLSYVPPFLFLLLTGQGIYQHGYHILLVLLASGVATGAGVKSPRLGFFLVASMSLNVAILLLDAAGVRLPANISMGALVLLALSVLMYYLAWGMVLYLRWRIKQKK